jgi:Tfp pilus assembly protein PilN
VLDISTHNGDELAGGNGVRERSGTRDRFVANTSIKIDQLQSALAKLEREMQGVKTALADLQDMKQQQQRLAIFHQGEARSRDQKLDSLLRAVREHKVRLDRIENPSGSGDYHHFHTFEAVSRQLAQLPALKEEFARAVRNARVDAWLFCATWALLCVTLYKIMAL